MHLTAALSKHAATETSSPGEGYVWSLPQAGDVIFPLGMGSGPIEEVQVDFNFSHCPSFAVISFWK